MRVRNAKRSRFQVETLEGRATPSSLILAVPTTAEVTTSQATTETVSFKGAFAQSNVQFVDASGIVTQISMYGFESASNTSGKGGPQSDSGVSMSIYQYNQSTGMTLFAGYGSVSDPSAFQHTANLSSASVRATVPVYDYVSNTTTNVDVNASLSGTGGQYTYHDNSHSRTPYYTTVSHYNSTQVNATVTGTVTVNGTAFDLSQGSNFYSVIGTTKSGSLSVSKTP